MGFAVATLEGPAMKLPGTLILAALATLPAAAHATDISGLWQVSTTVSQAPVVMDCAVLQVGVRLSGSCAPQTGDTVPAALTGQLDATRATWGYDLTQGGRTVHLAYSGTLVAPLAMTGSLSVNGVAAPFTAARR